MLSQAQTRNRLLASLDAADFLSLQPLLTPVELPVRKILQTRGRLVDAVYFPESGIVSVVVNAGAAHSIEVGILGNEGMSGTALFLGVDLSPNDTFVQSAGTGWRLSAEHFLTALDQSKALRRHLSFYLHTVMVQMQYTTLSDGRYKIDERLARWLLMAMDRVHSPVIELTHEFLAVMLGVRRSGVTNALNDLVKRGMIESARGKITILSRTGLQEAANGSYGAPEAEYDRCFGSRLAQ